MRHGRRLLLLFSESGQCFVLSFKIVSLYSTILVSRSYLLKADGKVVERPQHMIMRVSVGIHKDDIDKVIETYDLMSQRLFTHATPTLFNAGTPKPQMSSCFLLTMKEDSISGIYDTLKQVRDCISFFVFHCERGKLLLCVTVSCLTG